jgi:hypothetical protein
MVAAVPEGEGIVEESVEEAAAAEQSVAWTAGERSSGQDI